MGVAADDDGSDTHERDAVAYAISRSAAAGRSHTHGCGTLWPRAVATGMACVHRPDVQPTLLVQHTDAAEHVVWPSSQRGTNAATSGGADPSSTAGVSGGGGATADGSKPRCQCQWAAARARSWL